ncbi:MAG: hypothetical protein GY798_31710 [Hyphomicrobiales bacterium]|nr:hypothetical protein [Hyphomicrobiales bacterium]
MARARRARRVTLAAAGAGPSTGPTRQTQAKFIKPSFARWIDQGAVTGVMLQAATEIESVYFAKTSGLKIRPPQWERVSGGAAAPLAERIAIANRDRYGPWAHRLSQRFKRGGPPALETTVDIVIDQAIAAAIDAARRWRKGTAKVVTRRALLEYAVMAGWAPYADLDRFDAAHDGYLGTRWAA